MVFTNYKLTRKEYKKSHFEIKKKCNFSLVVNVKLDMIWNVRKLKLKLIKSITFGQTQILFDFVFE